MKITAILLQVLPLLTQALRLSSTPDSSTNPTGSHFISIEQLTSGTAVGGYCPNGIATIVKYTIVKTDGASHRSHQCHTID